jgi:hypothetical protein
MNAIPSPTLLRAGTTLAVAALGLIAFTECSDSSGPNPSHTVYGPPVGMGNGTATGYVTLDKHGTPLAVGAELAAGALAGLPAVPGKEYVLALPNEASITSVDHIVINWQPHGHPPAHIYTVPHLDVHLYKITETERAKISPNDPQWLSKVAARPPADEIPANYVADPNGIPHMGRHWADSTATQYHGHAFTSTFIYGTYDASFIFYEPMVTIADLDNAPNLHAKIGVAAHYASPGYYPSAYSVLSDAKASTIRIQVDGWSRY